MKSPVKLFEIGTDHIFENLHAFIILCFILFCMLQILRLQIIDEENIPSFQECSVIIWQSKFLLIFKNSSVTAF